MFISHQPCAQSLPAPFFRLLGTALLEAGRSKPRTGIGLAWFPSKHFLIVQVKIIFKVLREAIYNERKGEKMDGINLSKHFDFDVEGPCIDCGKPGYKLNSVFGGYCFLCMDCARQAFFENIDQIAEQQGLKVIRKGDQAVMYDPKIADKATAEKELDQKIEAKKRGRALFVRNAPGGNYEQKVVDAARKINHPTIAHAIIQHDDECDIFKGGKCNCNPDIKVIDPESN